MSSKSPVALQRAMPRAARPQLQSPEKKRALIVRQIGRFPKRVRQAVALLASRHDRLADLVLSFPALLFAIAVRRRHVDADAVIAKVIAGAGLAELAADIRIPMWTRKLRPEILHGPLPDLPDGDLFRRQIGNILPKLRRGPWTFLNVLSVATAWCDENFAIWCAREYVKSNVRFDTEQLRATALWAWHSHHPDTPGHRFCEVRWHPSLSYGAATDAAEHWICSMESFLAANASGPMQMWLKPMEIDGFSIVPLDTVEAIMEEAAAMKNCMRGYGVELLDNTCRFWSVRSQGERRAVLNVVRYYDDPIPRIQQLRGPENKPVDPVISITVARWLQAHDLAAITAARPIRAPSKGLRRVWLQTWKPYWLDRGRVPRLLPMRFRKDWRWRLQRWPV